MLLEEKMAAFLAELPKARIAEEVAETLGESHNEIEALISIYCNEAQAALKFVLPHLDCREQRILEVGSGLCLLSLFLKREGYSIVAEEPALGGFDRFSILKAKVLDHYGNLALDVLEMPVQDVRREESGKFDLIFSHNVIEHIPELEHALEAMTQLLSPQGYMVHSCPNYAVPYEPHFGIPVIKHCKWLSERVFRAKIEPHQGLWDSLNFITYFDVKRFARVKGLAVHFYKGLLYQSLMRLDKDGLYRERQSGSAILLLYRFLEATRLLSLLQYIPAWLSTPMAFKISNK